MIGGKIKRIAIKKELIEATKTEAAAQSFAMRAKGWKLLPITRSTIASIDVLINSRTKTAAIEITIIARCSIGKFR